jgi:hypothetical protein
MSGNDWAIYFGAISPQINGIISLLSPGYTGQWRKLMMEAQRGNILKFCRYILYPKFVVKARYSLFIVYKLIPLFDAEEGKNSHMPALRRYT